MSRAGIAGGSLPAVYLPQAFAKATAELLDSFASTGPSEGVVYWFGIESAGAAVVTTLIVPDAETWAGGIRTTEEANAEAVCAVVGTPLVLLGQAHSHPGSHVRHSATDDRETFAQFTGAISVVVPYFGRYGLNLDECGIHRFLDGRYREIHPNERDRHLVVLPSVRDLRSTPTFCTETSR